MNTSDKSYRPDIDGLRAVAVLSVVFCHARLGVPGGYIGVDVFFVISGYLITSLILKGLRQETFTLSNFWERRVRRILPALAVVTLATLVAGWFILMPDAYASLGKSVVGLALLASNVQFWRDTGYFATAAEEKPLLHTWSLSVEEQFYLFVPVFLFLLARRAHLRRAAFLLAGAAIISLVMSIYGTYRYPSGTFYLLPTRAWELFAGSLLAFLPAGRIAASVRWKEAVAVLGLAMILIPCFLYDDKTPFPGLAALPAVVGTALLIWSGEIPSRLPFLSRLLAWRPVVFVGLISYSLYLWHWPLFGFTRYMSIRTLPELERVGLVLASVVLAVISWRYVELPFRSRQFLTHRPRLFAVTAVVFLGGFVMGGALHLTKGFNSRLSDQTQLLAATGKFDGSYVRELELKDIPANLTRLGETNAPPSLMVWGDSHAMAILPAIDSLCRESGTAAVAATHAGTAPVVGYFSRNQWGLNERSIPFNDAVMNHILSGKFRTVLLVSFWNMHCEVPEFQAALLKTVDRLQAAGISVYLMKDLPVYEFDIHKSLVRYSYRGLDLDRLGLTPAEFQAEDKFPASLKQQLKERSVQILEPIPVLQARTKSENFLPYDSGGSFYFDSNHLSTYGSLALKPLFSSIFRSLAADGESSLTTGLLPTPPDSRAP